MWGRIAYQVLLLDVVRGETTFVDHCLSFVCTYSSERSQSLARIIFFNGFSGVSVDALFMFFRAPARITCWCHRGHASRSDARRGPFLHIIPSFCCLSPVKWDNVGWTVETLLVNMPRRHRHCESSGHGPPRGSRNRSPVYYAKGSVSRVALQGALSVACSDLACRHLV